MIYVISGKTEYFDTYIENLKNHKCDIKKVCHARTKNQFNKITKEDTVVLLNGWWGRSWAKETLKDIIKAYPTITFIYLDGPFGEIERKKLISDTISSRFDILDL